MDLRIDRQQIIIATDRHCQATQIDRHSNALRCLANLRKERLILRREVGGVEIVQFGDGKALGAQALRHQSCIIGGGLQGIANITGLANDQREAIGWCGLRHPRQREARQCQAQGEAHSRQKTLQPVFERHDLE